MTDLPKTFDPAAIEKKWYQHWESTGAFRPVRPDAEPYTIVNPPPNVTGSLHIGHALDNTLQDILIRHARMQGKDALWVVGMDHAGIATQMVVERQMEAQQDKRTNYSREDFIEKVWQWKAESGGQITGQLRRLGCSMDWSREQFTMDPHFSKAVTKVFVDLYNQGLIYRDKRLVNWDPKLKTAISDLEVETVEVKGHFWRFKYPLADGVKLDNGQDYIEVATTRPETMLADMAVAVNAADPRYASVIGQHVILPITGRRVPIVADEHADPELGSGAVKITPGHDFNDFEVGKRAGFKPADMFNMFDAEARVVQTSDGLIPDGYIGMDRFDARNAVVAAVKASGHLVPHIVKDKDGEETELDAEPRTIQTPYGDRGGVVIEPWLTDQWYVNAAELAKAPIAAVRAGASGGGIDIVPKSWEKTFFNWMENIQPWCVSRQLWWGHRIPAWYWFNHITLETQVYVAETQDEFERQLPLHNTEPLDIIYFETRSQALQHSPITTNMRLVYRDPDVLDTWFSSALWPFATLGWPDEQASPLPFRGGDGGGASPLSTGSDDRPHPNPSPKEEGLIALPQPQTSPPKGEDLAGGLLARHYPNNVLVSGFDILFFWDARMAMMGQHFMRDNDGKGMVPWRTLYLHGLVRAADGSKMSKSKGNTVDPLGLIDHYGADALRFFMAAMESQGRDIKMDERRVEGYRNFATKLWNAARFCQSNGIGASATVAAPPAELAVNRWIIGEVVETLDKLNKAFAEFRFDGMADAIYHFAWGTFCDWYLELIKPVLNPTPLGEGNRAAVERASPDSTASADRPHPNPSPKEEGLKRAAETRAVAGWVFDQILVMLHPFMPFITEELWEAMGGDNAGRGGNLLIHAQWPEPEAIVDADTKAEVEWIVDFTSAMRSAKNELGLPPGAKLDCWFPNAIEGKVTPILPTLERMARISSSNFGDAPVGASMQLVVAGETIIVPLEGVIDIAAEKARLAKALEAASKEAAALSGRLSNASFVEKAKPEAVEKARSDLADKSAEVDRLSAALARLG